MIDWNRVADLIAEIGKDDFDEVVIVFLEEVDEGVNRLSSADPATALGDLLHFLKGCALNLGFSQFATICATAEAQCNSGQAACVDVAEVTSCYAKARKYFLAQLPAHLAA